MWIPQQSFASTAFPTPLSAATNLHMAHIWAFIQEPSWYWGGYLMRRKSGRPFSFTVRPALCWQRGGLRTKSVSDPTELKSSQYTHTHTHTQVFLCYFPAWKAFVASCSTNCNKRRRLYPVWLFWKKIKRTAFQTTREITAYKNKETDAHIHIHTHTHKRKQKSSLIGLERLFGLIHWPQRPRPLISRDLTSARLSVYWPPQSLSVRWHLTQPAYSPPLEPNVCWWRRPPSPL